MMRKTADFRLVFAAGALAALACGGVSEQDFFDTPTPKRVQTGGAGGMSSVGTGGSSGGGTTGTTSGAGGTAAASGGATSTGGTVSTGGGNTGGTSSGNAGMSGDAGAGNASSSGGTVGGATTGGTGGSTGGSDEGGTGGSTAGTGGDGGAPLGGAGSGAGAGQGGMTMTGGAGASAGGHAGRGGGPGMTCAERLDALADKLAAAQECSMAQNAGCDDFVKDECGCEVPVNRASSAETKDFLNAVKEIGDCAECTRSSCTNYTRAYCRSSSGGGITGRCQGVGLTTL